MKPFWVPILIGVVGIAAGVTWFVTREPAVPEPPPVEPAASAAAPELTVDDRRRFEAYRAGRAGTRPALLTVVRRDLLARLDVAGSTVLELGAGLGDLYELVNIAALTGRFDLARVRWQEADRDRAYLQQPRRFPTSEKVVARLPDLTAVPDASVTHVTGLSVLSGIPVSDLGGAMRAIARVLQPGGVLIHLDDLGFVLDTEVREAARRGLIPLPYFDQPGAEGLERPMRLTFVDRARLEASLRAGTAAATLPPELVEASVELLASPVDLLRAAPLAALYLLAHDLSRLAVVRHDLDESVATFILRRLRNAAAEAGLIVEKAEEVVATATVDRDQVPDLPGDVTALERRYTVRIEDRGGESSTVRISAAVLVFVARLPGDRP